MRRQGAFHSPAHFSALRTALEGHGYEVVAPQLPSVGASPNVPDFSQDVATVRAVLSTLIDDQKKDVVLAAHSYGGVPGTEAAKGFAKSTRHHPSSASTGSGGGGGIIALVYMTAYLSLVGESCADAVTKGGVDSTLPPSALEVDRTTLQAHVITPIETFYHDCDPAAAQRAASLLQKWSFVTMSSPLTYAAYVDIPTTYLYCDQDVAVLPAKQLQLVQEAREKAGATIEVVTLKGSGHSPFIKDPEFVAGVIRKAAGEEV